MSRGAPGPAKDVSQLIPQKCVQGSPWRYMCIPMKEVICALFRGATAKSGKPPMSEYLIALVVLLGLGWTATLFIFAWSLVPMANTMKILEYIDAKVDKRVGIAIERAKIRFGQELPRRIEGQGKIEPPNPNSVAEANINRLFGEEMSPDEEQPDAVEVVEA